MVQRLARRAGDALTGVIYGIAAAVAAWWLGEQVASRREGLVAAALLSLTSFAIWQTPGYRLDLLLMAGSLAGTALFLRLLEHPDATRLTTAAYAIVMALGCRVHPAGIVVLAGHALTWIWTSVGDRRIPVRRTGHPLLGLIAAALLALLLSLPALDGLWQQGSNAGIAVPDWRSARFDGMPGGTVLLAVAGVLLLLGVASYVRRSVIAALLLVLPFAVLAVVHLSRGLRLDPGALVFAAGFAALLAVRGVFTIGEMVRRPPAA